MAKKQTYFQDCWLHIEEFKTWVQRGKINAEARCKICKSSVMLGNMGVKALRSHAKGKTHNIKAQELKQVKNFFLPKARSAMSTPTPNADEASNSDVIDLSSSPVVSQSTISSNFHLEQKLNAEVRWALKHVVNGYSNNSCKHTVLLFQKMFPDSKIATQMEIGPDKIKYIVNHGLAPHFKELLKTDVSKSDWFVVSFDESLNKVTQNCEMDLLLRFWDISKNRVQVRFWDSMFFGHGTHKDLFDNFNNGLSGLSMSKLTQISMDGPSVNWKFMSTINSSREEAELPKLVNTGSCSLHIIHGAFKTGVEESGWGIKKLLKGAYQVLKDTPARREDYISITGSEKFPLQFCATRWIEDKPVADRLIDIWPNMQKICKFWNNQPKAKRPSSKSFNAVNQAVNDSLILVKLYFFSYVADLLKPYLTKYQTEKPMVPYIFKDLELLCRNLLEIIIKPSVLNKLTGVELVKINLNDSANFLKKKDIHLGFKAEQELKNLRKTDSISLDEFKKVKKEAAYFIIALISKIFERCPIGSVIVRNSVVFDPKVMVVESSDVLKIKLQNLLHHLINLKQITSNMAQKASSQYMELVRDEMKANREKFVIFDRSIDRLDDFFFSMNHVLSSPELSALLQLVFTLSHGQACVERGFSVNNTVLETNMKSESIVARKMIIDHMRKEDVHPHSITLSNQLLRSVRLARQRYSEFLRQQKEKQKDKESTAQIGILNGEIRDAKTKQEELIKTCEMLNSEFVSLTKEAEKKNDMKLLIKGNGLKRKSEEKEKEIKTLADALAILQEKKQKLM